MDDDPYATLHVTPDAPFCVIRASYRALSTRYHPDKNTVDTTRQMARINAAYEILKDPKTRARYDKAHGIAPVRPPKSPSAISTPLRDVLEPYQDPNAFWHLVRVPLALVAVLAVGAGAALGVAHISSQDKATHYPASHAPQKAQKTGYLVGQNPMGEGSKIIVYNPQSVGITARIDTPRPRVFYVAQGDRFVLRGLPQGNYQVSYVIKDQAVHLPVRLIHTPTNYGTYYTTLHLQLETP